MWLNGELALQSITTCDAGGRLLAQEERGLVASGGTKHWDVTTQTYSDNGLVTSTARRYPHGHDFGGAGRTREQRPGSGDRNHDRAGPFGKGAGAGPGASGDAGGARPGHSYEHPGPAGK